MKQCIKVDSDGVRCSNRAVPGTDYCQTHSRILFKRLPKDPPPRSAQDGEKKEVPATAWMARPRAAGESLSFPTVEMGPMGLPIAREGLLRLRSRETQPFESIDGALLRLIACLSQALPIGDWVKVGVTFERSEALVKLHRPEAIKDPFPQFEAAAAAARLAGAEMFIGGGGAFIQYRDSNAPAGYDCPDVVPPTDNSVLLVGAEITSAISAARYPDVPLKELLLQISPVDARDELPAIAYILAQESLYGLLQRYLHSHGLRFSISRFDCPPFGSMVLFRFTPRQRTGSTIPGFALSYLGSLPRCLVLVESYSEGDRLILTQLHKAHPCPTLNIARVFDSNSAVFFTGSEFHNLIVSPRPTFFDGEQLAAVEAAFSLGRASITPEGLPFQVRLKLIPDVSQRYATDALILDQDEARSVQRFIGRIPPGRYSNYLVCAGGGRVIILGDLTSLKCIPLGFPLRRFQDSSLFVPLQARFSPELSLDLIFKTLKPGAGKYAFLTYQEMIEAPRDGFVPLSHGLIADRTLVRLESRPDVAWPPVEWAPFPEPVEPGRAGSSGPGKEPIRFVELMKKIQRAVKQPAPAPPPVETPPPPPQETPLSLGETLLSEANRCLEAGDHLNAALLFAAAGDRSKAASCYHEAALSLQNPKVKP